jgi:hypothetical protein
MKGPPLLKQTERNLRRSLQRIVSISFLVVVHPRDPFVRLWSAQASCNRIFDYPEDQTLAILVLVRLETHQPAMHVQ